MKRIGCVVLAEVVLAGMLVTLAGAQSQSLGDYARSVRKEEKPAHAKTYDNDNLPVTDKISVIGNATESSSPENTKEGSTSSEVSAKPEGEAAASSPESQDAATKTETDAQKVDEEWKKKIAEQQGKVDLLSRELDVMQREYRLRAAAFYADAGNRLRNQGAWDKEDTKYKEDLAKKQKTLDDAQKAADDLKEKARKAGVSAKTRQ
ncbi:MAG: hypothetical protein ACRD20_14715 [Terriglobales bacterium]